MTDASASAANIQKNSNNNNNKPEKEKVSKRGPLNDTAMHVLKGAIVTVLGASAAVTASVDFSKLTRGTLSIKWEGETLTQEKILEIQEAANKIIIQNVDIHSLTLPREEAEVKFKHLVNQTFIYDAFPVPEHIKELGILLIDNWTVNACGGVHLSKTGELKALFINKTKRREKQKVYEFEFFVGEDAIKNLEPNNNNKNNSNANANANANANNPSADNKVQSQSVAQTKASSSLSHNSIDSSVDNKSLLNVNGNSLNGTVFNGWDPRKESLVDVAAKENLEKLIKSLEAFSSNSKGSTISDFLNNSANIDSLRQSLLANTKMHLNEAYTQGFIAGEESTGITNRISTRDCL